MSDDRTKADKDWKARQELSVAVCTENLIRVAGVNESPKLAR